MALEIITDPVTGKQFSRDTSTPGSTFEPHIPSAENQPKPSATTESVTSPSTIPPTALPESGISTSFTQDIQKGIEEATKNLSKLFSPEETPEQKAAKEAERKAIESRFAGAREEIQDVFKLGEFQRTRARELLGLSPAAIRHNIEEFSIRSENFDKQIARSIERLTAEETAALAANDLNYANQLRQQKIDFYNFQRQTLQDKFNFLSTAYNMLLTGKQLERQQKIDSRQEASDTLNTILGVYSGRGLSYEDIPKDVRVGLEKHAETLGIPLNVIKSSISAAKRDLQIVREGNFTSIYDKNTGQRINRFETPTPSSEFNEVASDTAQFFRQKINPKTGFIDLESYLSMQDLWRSAAPNQLRTFFLTYPPTVYLDQNETNPLKKKVLDGLIAQYKNFEKSSAIDILGAVSNLVETLSSNR